MKILTLNHEFPPVGGGASPVAFELCSHLVKLGHKVDVVTMHYKNTSRFEKINGFNIYRTPALRGKTDICHPHELATYTPGAFFKTLNLAKTNKYDVIHCHFVVPGGILAWLISRLTKTPYIITSHGSDVPGHNPERFTVIHKIIKPFWKFIADNASCITAPSRFLAQQIKTAGCRTKLTVIPNGIDVERFNPNVEKKKKILLCSRILKFKGFQYFIEAVKELELDWDIDIIGDGPYLPELKQLAADCKTEINFRGWVDKNDPKFCELYNESAIFVSLSSAENFPIVLIDAMAAGCAVIASDIPAHKEILDETGVFVELENTSQIRDKLLYLINSRQEREKLSRLNREKVKQFNWKSVTEKYIECYKSVKSNSDKQV